MTFVVAAVPPWNAPLLSGSARLMLKPNPRLIISDSALFGSSVLPEDSALFGTSVLPEDSTLFGSSVLLEDSALFGTSVLPKILRYLELQ